LITLNVFAKQKDLIAQHLPFKFAIDFSVRTQEQFAKRMCNLRMKLAIKSLEFFKGKKV
jgi:hypothetical protein